MKRIFSSIISGVALIAFGASFAGCAPEEIMIQDEITLGRCLTPTDLSAKVINGEFIEFDWTKSQGATSFVLELYSDEALTEMVETATIPADQVPYTWDLEADMTYYARVKAIDESENSLSDSNWAVFEDPLQTYAIKSSLNPELVDRTETSITVKWTKDPEVDHIRITPALNEEDGAYTRFDVSADAVAAAQVEVTGLQPSVNYTLAVHFKSAQRGTVSAWTRPSLENPAEVNSTNALKQAIADGAAVIKVAYADTAYNIGDVTLAGPLAIYGDATSDGTNPTIAGTFTTVDATTSIHLEALNLDGMGYTYGHMIVIGAANSMTEVSVINCKVSSFSKGIYYDNKGASVEKILWDGNYIENIEGNGGDVFDVRQKSNLPSIIFSNTTLTIGGRTYFRIDANATIGSMKMENCTLNNLCFTDNGNNNGIFNIRAAVTEFVIKDNVFLNMTDPKNRCALIGKYDVSAMPTEITGNYFYNCYDRFFIPQQDGTKLTEEQIATAAAEGRAILLAASVELEEDPCVDSGRDKLNIINAQILEAGAGDPRWHEAYVEIPEDLTQNVTETGKVWDLADGQVFKKMADKDMVRDGIRFYVKNTPVNFVANGFEFSGAATVGADGIPTDGAIGIKVNQPGHLYLSAVVSENGNESTPIVVSVDGKVAGSVAVGEEHKQICLSTLAEGEHMIYVYSAAGAVVLSELQWDDCTLDSPEVTIDKTSVMAGTPEKVTLSWPHVANADSYEITIGENKVTVSENSYVFSAESLSLTDGVYNIEVRAISAEATHVASLPAIVKLTVEVAENPIVLVETVWDGAYFAETVTKYFPDYDNNTGITENFSNKKLRFIAGGGKFKYGENATLGTYIQLGGTGAAGTKACIQFTAGGPGKVTVKALSSGDAGRPLTIALGEEIVTAYEVSDKSQTEPDVITADINSVSGDLINIYSGKSGINLYEIKWEPKAAGAGIPSDPTAIEETYFVDLTTDNGFETQTIADGDGPKTIGKLTFGDNAEFDGKRYKHKGASKLGEDGIPVNRFVSFKITAPGTISHKVISGSSSAADRAYVVALVTNVGGVNTVTELYNQYAPTSSDSEPVTSEVTAEMLAGVNEAATVYIYTLANCNTYAVGYDPVPVQAGIVDPDAISEDYLMDLTTDNGFETQTIADGEGPKTIGKLTFGDNAEFDGKRYKHKGASKLGEDGIPVNRFVSFKITAPGTISHKVISGSSSAADRAYVVALVTKVGDVTTVTELYNQYAPTSSDSNPVTSEVTADMLAGITESAVVYVYTLANCNTYAVGFAPAK